MMYRRDLALEGRPVRGNHGTGHREQGVTRLMSLIGSLTESQIRAELTASNAAIREETGNPALRAVLVEFGVDLATAFVLDWVPEQGEDIYTVLDGTQRALTVELPRSGAVVAREVTAVPFADFFEATEKQTRRNRLRLAVALDLLRGTTDATTHGASPEL